MPPANRPPAPSESFPTRVHALVRLIPRGRVMSYGDVAAALGHPRAARGVGRALAGLPDDTDVPWWRVLNRNGEISSPALDHISARQRAILEGEGVEFDHRGRMDRERLGWWPPEEGTDPR